MNFKLATAMTVIGAAAIAQTAFAQEQTETKGFYLGAGVGQFNAGIDDVNQIDNAVSKWKADDTAYKIFGGYRFNPFLGVELDYLNLGKPSGKVVPGFNVDSAVDGWAPYVVGTVPLGRYVELFGRVGYYFYDATTAVTDTLDNRVAFKEDSSSLAWGGGVGANIGEKLNLRFEYERYDLKGLDDSDALWLTAGWRF